MSPAGSPTIWARREFFIALLVGLIAPEFYFLFVRRNWVIKMPEQVPPAVTRGFMAVIPGFITILIPQALWHTSSTWPPRRTSSPGLKNTFSQSLMALGQHIGSIVLISFLIPLFWFFGLPRRQHPGSCDEPCLRDLGPDEHPVFPEGGITAVGTGANELAVWVRGSWDAYVFMGGSGATLPLILAFLLFSKVKEHKEIAKLGVAPGIFMINEPILFGIPIVLNPIFLIPFLLVQPVLTIVAYYATVWGIAGPIVNAVRGRHRQFSTPFWSPTAPSVLFWSQ